MKLKVKNSRFSHLKGQRIENGYEVECELRQQNKATCRVFVPAWGKEVVVRKNKLVA